MYTSASFVTQSLCSGMQRWLRTGVAFSKLYGRRRLKRCTTSAGKSELVSLQVTGPGGLTVHSRRTDTHTRRPDNGWGNRCFPVRRAYLPYMAIARSSMAGAHAGWLVGLLWLSCAHTAAAGVLIVRHNHLPLAYISHTGGVRTRISTWVRCS